MWTDKRVWAEVMLKFEELGWNYIDNLTWIRINREQVGMSTELQRGLTSAPQKDDIFARSKRTLLLFRSKAPTAKEKIRNTNQINNDVVVTDASPEGAQAARTYTYKMIEELLQHRTERKKKMMLVEVWGSGPARSGWVKYKG